ncbi:BMP family lipoprotein [Glycomyces buryatensis]|uniref:BMP family ABC transporter substrate-binding protein n=1 Tax=Glycomyces buryatensis TaxID=2570927 RepID=A0A4S8Q6D3_9ACTN|nr:BMP family ABC transporter substrate-binding protein [Glycomyces buryatensis]THV39680.1 BMP family ABC transporter substrate-binding protein [Glycomyces buryatensis]
MAASQHRTTLAVKPYKLALAGVAATSLAALAACGEAPSDTGDGNGDASFMACMVTDSGGVDDKSFNESSWAGMEAAAEENSDIEVDFKESSSEADYDPNLQATVDDGCNFIVGVGGLMAGNVTAAAQANTEIPFAIVDGVASDAEGAPIDVENVFSIQFDTAQSAFLAGYIAASQTESGKVATWGGLQIPPVTIFMDGFVEGVEHFNEAKDDDVEVLGWDVESQEGTFINGFEDTGEGKSTTENFISQGADIVMPVAGPAGIGALTAASENDDVEAIWVDTDGYESTDFGAELLTSAEKGLAEAVKTAVLTAYENKDAESAAAAAEPYIGTLENGGVAISPYHDFDSVISDETKQEVEDLQAAIIDGSVVVESPASPASE